MNKTSKILFVENRDKRGVRRSLFGRERSTILDEIPGVIAPDKAGSEAIINNFNKGNLEQLREYDLIIIHKSPLNDNCLQQIRELSKQLNKSMVFFTGGNSVVEYVKQDNYQELTLPAAELYSDRLIPFLTSFSSDNQTHLTELAYGKQWRLNYLFRCREIIGLQLKNHDITVEDDIRGNNMEDVLEECFNTLGRSYEELSEIDQEINREMCRL